VKLTPATVAALRAHCVDLEGSLKRWSPEQRVDLDRVLSPTESTGVHAVAPVTRSEA